MMSNEPRPPKWADRFLEWFCHPDLLEEIQGDVYELFYRRYDSEGAKQAKRRFIWDVLRSFRWSTMRKLDPYPIMLKSHFKIASRHLIRQRFYTLINILGLALGFACCLLILIYVQHERSYDRHHPETEQIYRMLRLNSLNDGEVGVGSTHAAPFARALKDEFPEVVQAGRVNPYFFEAGENLIRKEGEEQNTFEEGFVYIDQEIIDIFQWPFLYGNAQNALDEPLSMVWSKSKADLYFPNENPVGKTILMNNDQSRLYKITGVLDQPSGPGHLDYDFYLSLEGLENSQNTNWVSHNYLTYIKLHPEADATQLTAKLPLIVEKYAKPQFKEVLGMDLDEAKEKEGYVYEFFLQELEKVHLHSSDVLDYQSYGDIRYVWLFAAIALVILLMAAINFMNLSTARSANRAKEVGVRKVLGSMQSQLVGQFLTESFIVVLAAVFIGLGLAQMSLPYFMELAGRELSIPWASPWFLPIALLLAFVISLLSGLYPAFYLSSFRPAKVLKGSISQGSKNSWLRSTLVVFQFSAFILLIISTLVIYRQMSFIQNKKLGFEKDQVLIIQDTYTLGDKNQSLKKELLQMPEIQSVSISDYLPVDDYSRNSMIFYKGGQRGNADQVGGIQYWEVDHDYIETMGIKIKSGRDFSVDMPTDSQAVIINERAAQLLDMDQPGQHSLAHPFSEDRFPLIGIVEDFHFESMKGAIGGLVLRIGNSPSTMSLKVNTADMDRLIGKIEKKWNRFAPDQAFRFSFMDERYDQMYGAEHRTGTIFSAFALLAIVIACLGLFGLATFMAEQRTKEIGVRKILGASIGQLFMLLTSSYLRLIGIAFLLASPLAWLLMNTWLEDFAYRIALNWDIFALSIVLATLIAIFTISYQALRVATLNPAETLKRE
ncbi:MAG: FtsX-like permease family protein [Bacteroidota bacterium]